MSEDRRTYEDDFEHPIKAKRKDSGFEIDVRKMAKDEMPDDGIIYYVDTDCSIYEKHELEIRSE